jgi:chemotaxis-related protein WspB
VPEALAVLFQVAGERYAVPAAEVVEVVPHVPLRAVPGTHPGVVGLLLHREALLPVVDLSLLWTGRPAARRMSTRILVCRLPGSAGRRVGVVAERATRVIAVDPAAEEVAEGPATPGARGLGRLLRSQEGVLQWVRVGDLLDAEVLASLEREAGEPVP